MGLASFGRGGRAAEAPDMIEMGRIIIGGRSGVYDKVFLGMGHDAVNEEEERSADCTDQGGWMM